MNSLLVGFPILALTAAAQAKKSVDDEAMETDAAAAQASELF